MISSKTQRPRVLLVNRALVLNNKNQILLIQRSSQDNYCPDLWEFPGGKLDQGQDVSNSLEREVLEETGLFVIPTSRISYVESYIATQSKKYKGLPYVILIGICKMVGGKLTLSEEHQAYKWVSANEFERRYSQSTRCSGV